MCQFLVTTLFVVITTFHRSTKMFVMENMPLLILEIIVIAGVIIYLLTDGDSYRKVSVNCVLLFSFTVIETTTVVIFTTDYSVNKILMGFS